MRDRLLGLDSDDIDLAYDGDVNNLKISVEGVKRYSEYHSCSFSYENRSYTITSMRDSNCNLASLEEDAKRRDFTINAIYYQNKFIDPLNGLDDLKSRKLRRVAPYQEDPSRILRAIRFSLQLNFKIDNLEELYYYMPLIKGCYRSKKELQKLLDLNIQSKLIDDAISAISS